MEKHKFKLGEKIKDKVTGIEGIATCRAEFLNGCVKYTISPPLDKDGKFVDERWFDEQQLEIVNAGIHAEIEAPRKTGGPSGSCYSSQRGIPTT